MADAPWTERNCSISIFSNSRCGFSNYFPSEHNLITISSCNININSHLQSLQLSKTCIPSEGHLIFFRLGIFTLFCDYTICPHHRATLGIRWRRSVACSHPNHKGKTKPDRGVTPIVSRHLLISTGQLVPVGSGICRTCRGGIPNLDSMSFEDNDVHHKEQPFGGFEQVSTSASSAKEEFDPEQSKTVNTIQNRKRIKLEDTSIETHTCKTAESLSDDESFLDSQSQSLSQISSWSQENMETFLSDLNKGIDIISRGHSSPVKFQVRSDISSLKPSTKRTVKRKVVSAIDTVLNEYTMSEWSNNTFAILGIQLDTSTPKKSSDDIPQAITANTGTAELEEAESINYSNSTSMVNDSLNISGIEEQTSFHCSYCSYKTNNKSNFNKHKKDVNCSTNKPVPVPNEKKFICHRCSKEYKTKYGLSLHCKKHDNMFKYKCDSCQKGYNQMSQFKAHLVSHTRALGEKCNTCKKYFSTTSSLKRHKETCADCTTSKGVDKFQCDQCDAEFSRKYSLLYHTRSTHNSFRYTCDQCEKAFLWRSSLKAHMKTHI